MPVHSGTCGHTCCRIPKHIRGNASKPCRETQPRLPVQVNLDYASEADMVDKLRIGLALQPAAIALFANSAFRRGREASMSCWRSNTYLSIDPSRCGMLPFVFSPDFGFEAYAQWALDAPMILAYRGGTELECRASSFRDFIPGRMAEVPGAALVLVCQSLLSCSPCVRLAR